MVRTVSKIVICMMPAALGLSDVTKGQSCLFYRIRWLKDQVKGRIQMFLLS